MSSIKQINTMVIIRHFVSLVIDVFIGFYRNTEDVIEIQEHSLRLGYQGRPYGRSDT